MPRSGRLWDTIMIGSGPNGLSAAASLAQKGFSVLILEAADEIGGGARTLPLTLPGFRHDICSAIHPLAVSSPAFRRMPLSDHGLQWVHPDAPLAHPLDGGRAITLERSISATASELGHDGTAWHKLLGPVAQEWNAVADLLGGRLPRLHRLMPLMRSATAGLRSATSVWNSKFSGTPARALFAGLSAHSNLRLDEPLTAGFGMALGASGHAVGWPFPRGGAGAITTALASYLRSLGARFETGARVNSLDELPPCRMVLCDISPRELLRISGDRFPAWYRRKLAQYVYGPGAFKVDWALDGPVPWSAPACRRAGTVHLGGTAEEIADSERDVWAGRCPDRPFVLAAQHTLFDPSRAPEGKHTAWAYCHVPNGSSEDMTDRIERQIERFAPGFRVRILARSVLGPAALEARNSNLVGGDFCGGANSWSQLLTRPTFLAYLTPNKRVLICSAATPPGAGVHGLCGDAAARIAVRRLRPPAPQTRRWQRIAVAAGAIAIVGLAILLSRKRSAS